MSGHITWAPRAAPPPPGGRRALREQRRGAELPVVPWRRRQHRRHRLAVRVLRARLRLRFYGGGVCGPEDVLVMRLSESDDRV